MSIIPELINKIFSYIQSETNQIMKEYISFVEKLERKNKLYRIKKDKFIYMIWLNKLHGYHIFHYERLCNTECQCFNIFLKKVNPYRSKCYCCIHGYLE
jgi:hypothetical protein